MSSNLTESRALVSDASGKVAVSDVTATELGYLDGVKSNIQEQIDDINEISATYVPWSSVDSEATANTIPQRDDNGCIDTATPVNDSNASNKGYTDSQDAVSQYNLGAFDVFTDNGDGNGDILRATYYLKIDADTSASAHMEPGRIYIPFDYQKTFVEIKGDNGAVGDIRSSQGVCTTPNNTWENYTDGISYNCTTNTLQIQISRDFEGQTLDSVETVREYFGAHPLYLQLKLNEANQYHESVILDQPINTLDQQAMWSIREEWEKRLNVLSPTYSASSRLSYSDDTFTLTSAVSGENIFRAAFPNGTYTISLMLLSKPSVNTSFSLYDGDSNDLGSYPNIQTYNLNQVYTETVTITKGLFRMTIWGAANNPTFSFKMWINKGGVSYPFTPYHTSERLYSHCITIKYGYITDASSIDVQFLTLIFTLPPITKSEAYTSIFQIKDDIVSMGFVGKCALTASGYVRGGGVYGNEKYILGVIGSTENKLIFVTQGHDEDDFDEINTSKDWDLSDINLEKLSINDIVI